MKPYIGTKIILAEPMTNLEFAKLTNKTTDLDKIYDGYKVEYEDGYISWSPKEVFERCYRPVTHQEGDMASQVCVGE